MEYDMDRSVRLNMSLQMCKWLNCYLNKNTYLEFNVVIVGHKKVPYSVNPFLS